MDISSEPCARILTALNSHGQSTKIFENIVETVTFKWSDKPSRIVQLLWNHYERTIKLTSESNPALNGKVFEKIVTFVLLAKGIEPIFEQAKVAFVPNVEFDLLMYNKASPVALSLKTSLRERYKQADLEAVALKYVHRKAKAFLITLNETEAPSVKKKIETGDVLGLDDVIVATSPEFDALVDLLGRQKFEHAHSIPVVQAQRVLVLQ